MTVLDACRTDGHDVLLAVWMQPGASRTGPAGTRKALSPHGGAERTAVVWRVTAPAVDGRANAALCRAIAEVVGVRRGAVELVRGGAARAKVVRIRDRTAQQVTLAIASGCG